MRYLLIGFLAVVALGGAACRPGTATQAPVSTGATPDVPATVAAQVRATVAATKPTAAPTTRPTAVPTAVPTVAPAGHPTVGETGWLYAKTVDGGSAPEVPVADDPATYMAFVRAKAAKDDVGMNQMLKTLQLIPVATGTQVRVIDARRGVSLGEVQNSTIDLSEVRFIDGMWATTTAWLDASWIVYQLPPGFAKPTAVPGR